MRIVRCKGGPPLAEHGVLARTGRERRRGLLGTRNLPEGQALVLDPANNVHMLGMKYPLYIVYLDQANRVLWQGVLPPWRLGPFMRKARRVIEMPASRAGTVEIGDVIQFVEEAGP